MDFVENLTATLGISIRSLAHFLRIHHSLLARYDSAERTLPRMALPEVMELYNLAAATQQNADPLPNEQQAEQLQLQADWCAAQCRQLRKKLMAVQQCYQQANTVLLVLDAYEEKSSEKIDDKRKRWIEEQRYAAEQKAAANGWETQYKIRLQIARLEREVEMGKESIALNFSTVISIS